MEPPAPRRAAPEQGLRGTAAARRSGRRPPPPPSGLGLSLPRAILRARPRPGAHRPPPPPPLRLWVRRFPRRSGLGAGCPRSARAAPPPHRLLPAQAAIFCSIVTKERGAGSGRRQPEVEARAAPRRRGPGGQPRPARAAPALRSRRHFGAGQRLRVEQGVMGMLWLLVGSQSPGSLKGTGGQRCPLVRSWCGAGGGSVSQQSPKCGAVFVTSGVCAQGRGDSV